MSNNPKSDPIVKSYNFLLAKEKSGQSFTIAEICDATGWKTSTAQTYVTKKWDRFLSKTSHGYAVTGVSDYELSEYIRLMSQKNVLSADPRRPQLDIEVERLIVKAREAAINALDSYNRIGGIFRTESFIVMMVIAWRSLFHAIYQYRGKSFIYSDANGNPIIVDGEEKAWELKQCIDEYFGSSNNPIQMNLKFIIELRNKIEHRYVPAIDPHVAGECQACVLNFDELLVDEFGEYYALRESLAVPLQTASFRSQSQVDALKRFQGKQYDDLKDFIDTFRSNVPDPIYQDPHYSFRVYLIPKTGNHENSSDIAFEFVKYDPKKPEDVKSLERQVVLIKERQVPVANAGTFKPSQIAEAVSQKTGRVFKIHHHTSAWKMYKVRLSGESAEGCRTEYCQYDQVHGDYIYTQQWIDFLVKKLSDEAEYQKLLAYKG